MGFEHLPQRARRATGKVLDRAGNLIYVALADRSPVGGNLAGRRLGHAGCGETLDDHLVVNGYGLAMDTAELEWRIARSTISCLRKCILHRTDGSLLHRW
jgi:hypothetical protein